MVSAFVLGGLIAIQAHINGVLSVTLGSGLGGTAATSVISFGSGFVILCLICVCTPTTRRGVGRVRAAVKAGRLRSWHLLGGVGGALLVTSQSLTVATIGVALFTVAVVAGQTSSAMLADKLGMGPAGRRRVTAGRLVGAVLAVVAVALTVSEHLDGASALAPATLLLAAFPLLAGIGTALQQAVNGQVSVVGGPLAAAWINFLAGMALLVPFGLVATWVTGPPPVPPAPWGPQWWLYLPGVIGVLFISAAAVLVRILGVLLFGLGAVSGQVVTALVVDVTLTDIHVGALTVSGVLLTLLGVGVAASSARRAGDPDAADSPHTDDDPQGPESPAGRPRGATM